MGTSRIEQSIEDIFTFIEGCKSQPFARDKVIVPKEELYDLLDELRLRAPDEIKRYKKVLANREAIMADAEEKAANIIEETRKHSEALVNESEIMQQAFEQANQVVTQATEEARKILEDANQEAMQIRTGALSYTNDLLFNAEQALTTAYDGAMSHYQGLTQMLKDSLNIIKDNRKEMGMDGKSSDDFEMALTTEETKETDQASSNDDFNFDADTFLENID